ncbi:uncharacterized protein LOC143210106 [Lasioglossum baleicum]|uniref:uncharacterized protein LOC143210106 n=1 Tax=Lasioglossum baleicum TaxID=434251 RepID=UPI003FCCA1E6
MSLSSSTSSDHNYPSFIKEYVDNVTIYWYNEDFAQSRYPRGQRISKACTLICLLVAQRISATGLSIYDIESTPEVTNYIAEAMVEGNATHAWIVKNGLVSHPYLSTEEALRHGGDRLSILKEWTFQVFHDKIERSLYHNINNFLHKWYASSKSNNLFMLLITCGRTVLFIFQENTNTVTFFDSHNHQMNSRSIRGLVVAQTAIEKLQYLCKWYIEDILNQCYNIKSEQYELAFLYPKDNIKCCGCNFPCSCTSFCHRHIQ